MKRLHGSRLPRWASIAVPLAIGMLAAPILASAAGPTKVGLGTAGSYAVLAGTPAVTNTGPTTITGDVGIAPAVAVTGFPPGTVNGSIHTGDAAALQAKTDLVGAYEDAAGRSVTATHGALGDLTLVAGVYNSGSTVLDLTGTLTLDGQDDPSSVWVFQATSSLVTASSSSVALINGASPCNVFWQVTSSATLGSGSSFVGTIMALTSITVASGVAVNGRALARNGDVTLINDTITNSCVAAPAPSTGPSTRPPSGSTAGTTPPPTSTLAATDVPGTGPTLPVFIATFLAAVAVAGVVLANRSRRRAIRIR